MPNMKDSLGNFFQNGPDKLPAEFVDLDRHLIVEEIFLANLVLEIILLFFKADDASMISCDNILQLLCGNCTGGS